MSKRTNTAPLPSRAGQRTARTHRSSDNGPRTKQNTTQGSGKNSRCGRGDLIPLARGDLLGGLDDSGRWRRGEAALLLTQSPEGAGGLATSEHRRVLVGGCKLKKRKTRELLVLGGDARPQAGYQRVSETDPSIDTGRKWTMGWDEGEEKGGRFGPARKNRVGRLKACRCRGWVPKGMEVSRSFNGGEGRRSGGKGSGCGPGQVSFCGEDRRRGTC
jgi:hypothetical protein